MRHSDRRVRNAHCSALSVFGRSSSYELRYEFSWSERSLRSVSAILPLFAWDEREMAQDHAVTFEGLPDARPFADEDGVMPSPIIAHGEGLMHLVVGPCMPASSNRDVSRLAQAAKPSSISMRSSATRIEVSSVTSKGKIQSRRPI